MDYRVKAKLPTDKWWSFGSIKNNKFGKLQLSFKNTQQFKDHVNNGGEWLNFSLFPEEEELNEMAKASKAPVANAAPARDYDDSEIPF